MTTRIGTIFLAVPRYRYGHFETDLFNRYQRSEQTLVLAMIENVINGVSTRKSKNSDRRTLWSIFFEIKHISSV